MELLNYNFTPESIVGKNRIAIVTGVSASGKDFLLEKSMEAIKQTNSSLSYGSFGELLQEKAKNIESSIEVSDRDDLKHAITQDRMKVLIDAVVSDLIRIQPVIINTHVVYNQQGSLLINPDVNERINAIQYIFVGADPNTIRDRRLLDIRRRENESVSQIFIHQQIALEASRIMAESYGARFTSIDNRSDNIDSNIALIREIITKL